MARNPHINTTTGQYRVIRKKGDLTSGKGDWSRIPTGDEKYKEGYDRIFGKRNILIDNKVISKDESTKKH